MRLIIRIATIILAFAAATPVLAADIDWSAVEAALGRKASVLPGDVHRFGMPRGDLHVTLGDVAIRPALALGAWAAFHPVGDGEAMVMGDLVVTDVEVAPVMKVLGEGGVAVTALHNHLVGEQPKIMYIHMGGRGDPVAMARTIKAAIDLTSTPPPAVSGKAEPANLGFDVKAVENILRSKGTVSGGVLHIGVPRAEEVTMGGMTVPSSMGTGTAINFQPAGNGRAVTYGDFALAADEVATAIRTLRENGIETMALHNHMLGEEPRLFYAHFWGEDDALTLAQGLKAALAQTNVAVAADPLVSFDDVAAGGLPQGWTCGVTGRGSPVWKVEADPSAPSAPNVLKQSGSGTFPWCAMTSASITDGYVEVRFKPLEGREDQAGGLVWRFKDGDNYYVARANALENNVSLYYTENGRRRTVKYVDAPVPLNQWHTLRVEFADETIKVFLDGRQYIDLTDAHIAGAGAVGVWTKADSVTAFDDFAFAGR